MLSLLLVLTLAVALWPLPELPPPEDDGADPTRRSPLTGRDVADATVLLAVALRSGQGLVESIEQVARVSPVGARDDLQRVAAALRWGRPMREAWSYARPVWRRTGLAFAVSDESGAASSSVLLAAASAQRDEQARAAEAAGARAGVHLVLPLGLCFLPAFIATAIVPLVLVMLADQLGG